MSKNHVQKLESICVSYNIAHILNPKTPLPFNFRRIQSQKLFPMFRSPNLSKTLP